MQHKWTNVIEAYINGQQIQTRRPILTEIWHNIPIETKNIRFPNFNDPDLEWRIMPKMKRFKCRLALFMTPSGKYYVQGFDNSLNHGVDDWFCRDEDPPESAPFIRWITDCIEFDVESDDA